MFKAGILIE